MLKNGVKEECHGSCEGSCPLSARTVDKPRFMRLASIAPARVIHIQESDQCHRVWVLYRYFLYENHNNVSLIELRLMPCHPTLSPSCAKNRSETLIRWQKEPSWNGPWRTLKTHFRSVHDGPRTIRADLPICQWRWRPILPRLTQKKFGRDALLRGIAAGSSLLA